MLNDKEKVSARFQTSSACAGGTCVGVAFSGGKVLVRRVGDTSGPVLEFSLDEWSAFLEGVKRGEFDEET